MKNLHEESQNRLQHIEKAITDIEKFVKKESIKSFGENEMLHDAVMLQFIIIGEAINHVEAEKLEKYDYPWYKVRSLRNMIAHEYFNIKLDAVWQIIKKDLPELKKIIQTMLKKEY
ncbi:MAG TPA: HepT-like ribonuclease domain-containing protein [Chitinophagaceae bacterium]|nr:HepT-like ribonuclease domain-containing protein [Chitinophagaceae bacterium]